MSDQTTDLFCNRTIAILKHKALMYYDDRNKDQQPEEDISYKRMGDLAAVCRFTKELIEGQISVKLDILDVQGREANYKFSLDFNEHAKQLIGYIHAINQTNLTYMNPNPYLHLFVECFMFICPLDLSYEEGAYSIRLHKPIFSSMLAGIAKLIEKGNSDEFKNRLNEFNEFNDKNRQYLCDDIEKVFTKSVEPYLMRMDLFYNKGFLCYNMDDAHAHMKSLMNFINKIDPLIYGVIRIEYSAFRGIHYHAAFFFTDSVKQNPRLYTKKIGQYWQDIASHQKEPNRPKTTGNYYDCSKNHTLDRAQGCGPLPLYDRKTNTENTLTKNHINQLITYLTCSSWITYRMDPSGKVSLFKKVRI